jgi:CNT family concentrative nucleoside transporter
MPSVASGGDVSRLAFSALISGVMATLTSANVAGLVISSQTPAFT